MNNFRIYYYISGSLHHHPYFEKSYNSLEEIKIALDKYKHKSTHQWVIVEYLPKFDSKIIEVITYEN